MALASNKLVPLKTTEAFIPLYDERSPYYKSPYLTFYGGRGGRKSWEIARALLIRGYKEKLRILCAREFQNSISDSVISVLEDQAAMIGLSGFYEFQKTTILGANGTEFIFKGLRHNIQSLKSTEGVDLVWLEEGETTSEKSWTILLPTIRKPGSQIITSFNTAHESDPTYQRLVVIPGKDPEEAKLHYTRLVTYLDNPDISENFIKQAELMKRNDPDAYANIYLGEPWSRSEAQVLSGKWRVDELPEEWKEGADGAYHGLDFGFSVDPSAFVRLWVKGRTLYIEREAYEVGVEVDDYPEFLNRIPGIGNYKIRADNARPELISHIKRRGFNIVSCKKWEGSVEDGISLLRSFDEIVINPSCKNTIREARLWRYKVDRLSGDVLPVLVDANNHAFDAVRYALEGLVKPTKDISIRVA